MTTVNLLSFNIHGGKARDGIRDLNRIRQLMDSLDIDIGVFQEIETRMSRGGSADDIDILSGPDRPHHLFAPSIIKSDGWYGNLIVSRYPIVRGIVHNLETKSQFEPRNAVDALIETPKGLLRVIGTHLSLFIFERRAEARNLIRLINAVEEKEKNPILLMGDINEWQMPSGLLSFLDSHLTPIPCKATFPSWLPFLKLDRVWYSSDHLEISAERVDGSQRKLSDHLPVLVRVS